MLSREIRRSFLDFFAGRGHLVLPSSSLIPQQDPTVLLTTAGMQQFKPYFGGTAEPPSRRVTTVQKCFRTVDLEEVGDATHLTFFEMLGNFSFGDYFKEGAIELAWEYLTKELGLDPGRLHPAIHPSDDEAAAIWRKVWGAEPLPLEDNFWPSNLEGWVGPCGPDSEIYWDLGVEFGCGQADCRPGHCDRYMELWNLVFPQYDRAADGAMDPLDPPGIDTGMGLERLAAVLQGVPSIHDTDIFKTLRESFEAQSFGPGGVHRSDEAAYSLRLLADHSRATAFLIADGVRPSNEGRGYVLRRMIRRATRHALRRLNLTGALSGAVDLVGELMGDAYPELLSRRDEIERTLVAEEEAFARTLEAGEAAFNHIVASPAVLPGAVEAVQRLSVQEPVPLGFMSTAGAQAISGEDAFRLHDTHGFPIEMTVELAAERGLTVDREGFERLLAEQRDRSRRAAKKTAVVRTGLPSTEFLGYDELASTATVTRLFGGDGVVDVLEAGLDGEIYLDRTPFYAEGGGQVGDQGLIEGTAGTFEVRDVQRQGDAWAHYGRAVSGRIATGDQVQAAVDRDARWRTMRHHSATHLLHRSLREVLGENATQAGSYVGPTTCTFDFSFSRAVTPEEMDTIFAMVNRAVRDDLERTTKVMPLDEARKIGAMMLFGEKYGDTVRVVSFESFSSELCGGTHVDHSGEIGFVVPVSERSVGAGVRRIEFLAGDLAERQVRQERASLGRVAEALRVGTAEVPRRVEALIEERRQLQRQVEELRRKASIGGGETAMGLKRGKVVGSILDEADPALLRATADGLLDRDREASVAVVGGKTGGRLAVKVRKDSELSAGALLNTLAKFGGRGGGGGSLALGGGYDLSNFGGILDTLDAEIAAPAGGDA
jgi:alanyl-tRNA synthetase